MFSLMWFVVNDPACGRKVNASSPNNDITGESVECCICSGKTGSHFI